MRGSLLPTVLVFALCAPLLSAAQSSQTQSGQTQPSQETTASTLQANANLVVVDVVVSDKNHNPVHKLTKADFTLLEDGKAQAIKNFEEHSLSEAPAPLPAMPKLPPGVFTNYSAAPAEGALNILLLDSLNTPMLDQARVRQQMLQYLNEARRGTRIAIFGLTTRLFILQGFTSNPELLRAVLAGKKNLANASPLMDNAVSGDYPGADDPMMDNLQNALGNDPSGAEVIANMQQFESDTQSYQLQLRARYTLDGFNQLARYLGALPGRKNLIWFSASFPIDILPDGDLADPFSGVASAEDEFRETAALLSSSQVAVYPIDARGLMVQPMFDAGNSGAQFTRPPARGNPNNGGGANNFSKALSTFFQQSASEKSTMNAMAQATGGESFTDTNGLKEAVEKAIEAGSNYYTLSYTPTNEKWNGAFRKIQVQLARQDAALSYRRGYFAIDTSTPHSTTQPSAPARGNSANPAPFSPMLSAMLRGGPEPTQIIFETAVWPNATDTDATLVPANRPVGKISGPYRRYTIQFAVNPGDLGCAVAPDGGHRCALESAIFVYDAKGAVINTQSNSMNLTIPADRSDAVMKSGIQFLQEISVPVKTGSFLRIGVHDAITNHVGAIELPVSEISKLKSPAAAAPKP